MTQNGHSEALLQNIFTQFKKGEKKESKALQPGGGHVGVSLDSSSS